MQESNAGLMKCLSFGNSPLTSSDDNVYCCSTSLDIRHSAVHLLRLLQSAVACEESLRSLLTLVSALLGETAAGSSVEIEANEACALSQQHMFPWRGPSVSLSRLR
jgi:hypothetical protein